MKKLNINGVKNLTWKQKVVLFLYKRVQYLNFISIYIKNKIKQFINSLLFHIILF